VIFFLQLLQRRLFGWELNVPFQHKIGLYLGQGLGWRFSSIRLRMAKDTVTSDFVAFLLSDNPKLERIWQAHLNYYASTYIRVETI